jgi:UDP-N-acetylmuramate--alanine ligase
MTMKVHLMGAGGAGVSALARVFLARGDDVSGCDLKESDTTAELEEAGVKMLLGHDPEHVLGQDLLVYSGAIKRSPELDAARAMAVRVLSRAEMLAQLINESDSIAVAGTAGKTTITHMVGHILVTAGYDPTVLVGDGSSARAGRSEWLVAETDESDGTLTLHHPQRAIVTNIELDHPDHFRDVSAVRDLFQWFIEGLPQQGLAVLCADDELARELRPKARKVTYGFRHGADYRCEPVRPFPIYKGADLLGHVNLRQPGRHNIQNATGAAAMALELGIGFGDVAAALHTFPGAHRRMEFLGVYQGAALYDDYAHHPTKVRATIQAARELRHRRLIVVFQPHRYSRLAALMHDFARSFEGADRVFVLDVYSAGEDNVSGVQASDLAHQVPRAIYVGSFEKAREALSEIVGPDDLVLLMGAGDIKKLGDELAHKN